MCDDVFDDDTDEKVLRIQELDRVQQSRKLDGYREGVIAGKDSSLQDGFDDGFKEAAAAMSRLGKLQGMMSALLTYQGSGKTNMLPPGDLCEVESLQREVAEFEERTRTSIKTQSRLPALPTDGDMEESSKPVPSLDKSIIGERGSTSVSSPTPLIALTEAKTSSLVDENSGKGVVLNIDSDEKMFGIFAAPPSDKQESSPPGTFNEVDKHTIATNGKSKYDLNMVKIQMKQINSDSIDMTKLTFLETKCHRVLEKFDLNKLCV